MAHKVQLMYGPGLLRSSFADPERDSRTRTHWLAGSLQVPRTGGGRPCCGVRERGDSVPLAGGGCLHCGRWARTTFIPGEPQSHTVWPAASPAGAPPPAPGWAAAWGGAEGHEPLRAPPSGGGLAALLSFPSCPVCSRSLGDPPHTRPGWLSPLSLLLTLGWPGLGPISTGALSGLQLARVA